MTSLPRIVIVNYNGAAFIEPALASARSQSIRCELVVVDNASTDDSRDVIRTFGAHIIANQSNLGFGMAANIGAFASTSNAPPYIAFLNPDAVAEKHWLEHMIPWMEQKRFALASSVISSDQRTFFAGGRWIPWLGASVTRGAYAGEESDWISGCALVARTAAFECLGGFDERYFLYFEDVDLSLRARRKGFRLGINPHSFISHKAGASTNQLGKTRKLFIGYTSKGLMMRRFLGPAQLLTALPFQLIVSPLAQRVSPMYLPVVARALIAGVRSSR